MAKDLRQFLQVVKEAGPEYYVEVKKPLDTYLEVGVVQHKLYRQGRSPVIYCPEIKGSNLPLVTNLFGSYEMLGIALGMEPNKVQKDKILHEYKRREADLKPTALVPRSEAPVKEVVWLGDDADLGRLPITHHALLDSGKYITPGNMICRDPDTGAYNVGMYRHEVKSKDSVGLMFNPIHHGNLIARRHAELNRQMEVVIFLGHHPAVVMGSMYSGGMDVDELQVMGGLVGEPLRVTQGETVDLPIPADAEIAIEGIVDPRNMVTDGPFGEFTGHYGEGNKKVFLIKVTAITMRKDAIFHDLDAAHPEHNLACVLGFESPIYDAVKRVIPTVKAVHCPESGLSMFHVYVSIKKTSLGQGKLAALAALGSAIHAKTCVVVDDDIDIFSDRDVLFALSTRLVPDRGVDIIKNSAGNHLDPAAMDETRVQHGPMQDFLIVDATKPLTLPTFTRITPPEDLWNSMKIEEYVS
ncbi:MAG: UbiD family decarboxylase [Chloroflexi bacterium]|nr:UbiD family decarboxylase [Chloroflexota bacterium]